mgnify:FL=1
MRTSPYGIEIRERVIKYINKGHSQKEAMEVFELHRNTVNRWYKRYKEEGHVEARKRVGNRTRKVDQEELRKYVELLNGEVKLKELGKKYGVSGTQIGKILDKLGFSYKKNL